MNKQLKSILFSFFSLSLFLALFPINATGVRAHSGRTDSSGCHNCYVGSCAGTYHCHNGGGSGGYDPPSPAALDMPTSNATYEMIPNDSKTYTITIDWDRPDGGQWSIGIFKTPGADPGPLTDTMVSKYVFTNVSPGTHYINLKEGMPNGYWSDVSYWKIDVPAWVTPVPSPSPMLVPTHTPVATPTTRYEVTLSANEIVSNGRSTVLLATLVLVFGYIGVYLAWQILKWLMQFMKKNDWVLPALLWGSILGGIWIYNQFFNQEEPVGNTDTSKYTCNCSKTCPNLSCEEAQYQLNVCGCSARDGDNDGTACDAQCR